MSPGEVVGPFLFPGRGRPPDHPYRPYRRMQEKKGRHNKDDDPPEFKNGEGKEQENRKDEKPYDRYRYLNRNEPFPPGANPCPDMVCATEKRKNRYEAGYGQKVGNEPLRSRPYRNKARRCRKRHKEGGNEEVRGPGAVPLRLFHRPLSAPFPRRPAHRRCICRFPRPCRLPAAGPPSCRYGAGYCPGSTPAPRPPGAAASRAAPPG